MRFEEYSELTPGEQRRLEQEMTYEGPEPERPHLELGECLGCGRQYIVDPDEPSDFCGPMCELLNYVD